MKRKRIVIIILIILSILIIGLVCFKLFHKSNNKTRDFEKFSQMMQSRSSGTRSSQEKDETITLSSKSEVKSALIESVELHATYYLEETYVETNSYVAKGEKILKYTNGTYLKAPYDCYIVELNVPKEEGKCLNSHYVKIQSKNILTVSMSVSEENIEKVSIGQEAKITITSLEKTYTGYVTHIGSTASNGKFTIDIEFENDGNIKLGMSSSIEITL